MFWRAKTAKNPNRLVKVVANLMPEDFARGVLENPIHVYVEQMRELVTTATKQVYGTEGVIGFWDVTYTNKQGVRIGAADDLLRVSYQLTPPAHPERGYFNGHLIIEGDEIHEESAGHLIQLILADRYKNSTGYNFRKARPKNQEPAKSTSPCLVRNQQGRRDTPYIQQANGLTIHPPESLTRLSMAQSEGLYFQGPRHQGYPKIIEQRPKEEQDLPDNIYEMPPNSRAASNS